MFLSSHILSEVEALCDRVGILRDGKLVEIGTLAEMRHLSALSVEATFDGPVPDLSAVPGVSALEVTGGSCAAGARQRRAAPAGARRLPRPELLSREPSLEELFLARYGELEPAAGHSDVG